MILADTFKSLLATIGIMTTRSNALLGVTGLVLFPLCLVKNLATLAPFSLAPPAAPLALALPVAAELTHATRDELNEIAKVALPVASCRHQIKRRPQGAG